MHHVIFTGSDCVTMLKYDLFRLILKGKIIHKVCKLLWKKITLFWHSIKISSKSIIFNDRKINKGKSYKNKKYLR